MRYSGLSSCPCVCACLSYLWSLSAVCLTEKLMNLWVVESGEFAHAHFLFHLFLVQSCSTFSKYLIIAQIRPLVLCFVVVNISTFIWPSVSSVETQLVKFFFWNYICCSLVFQILHKESLTAPDRRGVYQVWLESVTVEPLVSDHPRVQEKWSLMRGGRLRE